MEVLRRKGQEVIRNMGMVTRTATNVLCELNNNFVIVCLNIKGTYFAFWKKTSSAAFHILKTVKLLLPVKEK